MKKTLSIICAAFLATASAFADEGMWLPSLISQRIGDMQANGFKLSAEDIYSINQASLKDAVVLFGGGCTGELISNEGLLITNHHCGFSYIQKHSSVEHNYLKDGYFAKNRGEELPNPGLTVRFLERMDDVTSVVLKGYNPSMTEEQRAELVQKNSKALVDEAVAPGKGLKASVEAMYYGNQYYIFIYREYTDVRFVGAPASSIGKFGGETDNWMWPRHTGDFSIFRIYADKDNNPAPYSKDNVPYTPKKFFKVSTAGVNEGDFTFIYGFPGSTKEYIMSEGVKYVAEVSDPAKIALRTKRLDIQKKYMNMDPAIRIQYASKNSSIANSWKKWQGESLGINRRHTVQTKQEFEKGLSAWAKGSEYDGIVERLGAIYAKLNPNQIAVEYYNETIATIEHLSFASSYSSASAERRPGVADTFYKDYYKQIDKECFVAMISDYDKLVAPEFKPDWFKAKIASYPSVEAWAEELFAASVYADRSKLQKATEDQLKNDPALEMYRECRTWVSQNLSPKVSEANRELALANRDYMRAQMAYEPGKAFYPDANLTLRVAYGHVQGYEPSDGVYYYPVSTLKGIMEKDDPNVYDYDIPQALRDVYASGDYASTAVCFIASNHTSGGNSGSPVINADGNLIGLNFDRVWEGTMSDIDFDPSFCRSICFDIRYALFVMDKVYGANYVLDELTLVD
ncbi:MAG: S46 family peptidase [Bacteroidales bacterium]|nr:S46 family peptidase [Bacteroidales bacterium]